MTRSALDSLVQPVILVGGGEENTELSCLVCYIYCERPGLLTVALLSLRHVYRGRAPEAFPPMPMSRTATGGVVGLTNPTPSVVACTFPAHFGGESFLSVTESISVMEILLSGSGPYARF